MRPYNGTTSWKLFKDHFSRVAKVKGWTTNDDLVQHLTPSLEGAAAEIIRDFDDTSSTALADLWAKLAHRFREVDSVREAMRKFDSRRQSDSESLVEFEQALRVLHKEVWPTATAAERDAPLKHCFEDGVAATELSNYLRLHYRDLDFVKTVEKAHIYHATMEGSKAKKAVRFLNDTTCQQVLASTQDLLPVINHLKSIEGRLDKMVVKPGNQQNKPPQSPSTTPTQTSPPLPTPRLQQQQQQ